MPKGRVSNVLATMAEQSNGVLEVPSYVEKAIAEVERPLARAFLRSYLLKPTIKKAADGVCDPSNHYVWLGTRKGFQPLPGYPEAWELVGLHTLIRYEDVLDEQVANGTVEVIKNAKGEVIRTRESPASPKLIEIALRAHDRNKYGSNPQVQNNTLVIVRRDESDMM